MQFDILYYCKPLAMKTTLMVSSLIDSAASTEKHYMLLKKKLDTNKFLIIMIKLCHQLVKNNKFF